MNVYMCNYSSYAPTNRAKEENERIKENANRAKSSTKSMWKAMEEHKERKE